MPLALRLIEGLGLAFRRSLIVWLQLVKELPGVCAVELSRWYGCDERRIEVSQVNPMLDAGLRLKRLPVRDAAAGSAMNCF